MKVEEVRVQQDMKNLQGRSLELDVFAVDSAGKRYNIDYSDFRFIPINLFKYCFYKISKQVCRNNCFNNLLQVD